MSKATAATSPAWTSAEMNRTTDPSRARPSPAITAPTSTVRVNIAVAGSTSSPSAPMWSAATRASALVAVMTNKREDASRDPTSTLTDPAYRP